MKIIKPNFMRYPLQIRAEIGVKTCMVMRRICSWEAFCDERFRWHYNLEIDFSIKAQKFITSKQIKFYAVEVVLLCTCSHTWVFVLLCLGIHTLSILLNCKCGAVQIRNVWLWFLIHSLYRLSKSCRKNVY